MYKKENLSKKEGLREESLIDKNPQVHNEGVIVECNLLDNNYYNLEIKLETTE